MTETDWNQVYRVFCDLHQRQGVSDYHKIAFDDTSFRLAADERIRLDEARLKLNEIVPEKYRQAA